jgi:hypothetical protein
MLNFALGVIVTLAVLYPSTTKQYLGAAVDTAHGVATSNLKEKADNE